MDMLGRPKNAGNIGNANFVVGWQEPTANEYYSQYVNINTGTRNSPSDYYEVCSTSTTNLLALSSSSNSGKGILAAWWDGTDIYWKVTGNSTGYKPANDDDKRGGAANGEGKSAVAMPVVLAEAVQAAEGKGLAGISQNKARIYPNPTRDKLHVTGYDGAAYRITDVTGRIILSGTIAAAPIDVQALNTGCYILHIATAGAREAIRFAKY
jgi:hypothetical protein